MKKQLIPLSIFTALVIFLAIGLTLDPKAVPSPLIGKPVPDFKLKRLESDQPITPERLKGQIWILNVWASWCESCKQEHQVLLDLSRQSSVTLIGLNYKDTEQEARNWLARYGNPYQMVLQDPNGQTGIDLGVYGVPETFIIDTQGIIRHKITGPVTETYLRETLLPLLPLLPLLNLIQEDTP